MQTNQQQTIVEIEYCRDCGWLPRAAWLAQELLEAFERWDVAVTLVPGEGGVFNVRAGFDLLFSRTSAERLPDPAEIKKALRGKLMPVIDRPQVA